MRTLTKVEQLLRDYPTTRDSDKHLLLAFWASQGLHLSRDQRDVFLRHCTTAETITRARRSLKGKYPATKEVDDERYRKFIQYKNFNFEDL